MKKQKQVIVAEAVQAYAQNVFWDEVDADGERLFADPVRRAEYQKNLALYEGTLKDGLD